VLAVARAGGRGGYGAIGARDSRQGSPDGRISTMNPLITAEQFRQVTDKKKNDFREELYPMARCFSKKA
jgi:hypothetical protein